MVCFRNDALGSRGIAVDGRYVFVDPGETIEVDNPETVADGLVRVPSRGELADDLPKVPRALARQVKDAAGPTRAKRKRRSKAKK